MKRIAIDTNVIDFLLARPDLCAALTRGATRGALTIITNHVVEDELAATPCKGKRAALLAVYAELPRDEKDTPGFVFDVSRLDRAAVEAERAPGVTLLDDVTTRQRGRRHDALIATTASAHADVLVTGDDELAAKVSASGASVWGLTEFEYFLRGHMT
jgi:predicted nucleic acid-binding protein